MSMLALLLAISAIEWYIIDNLKEKIWGNLSWGNYITIVVSINVIAATNTTSIIIL